MKRINPEYQRLLGVEPDGLHGPNTDKAIRDFQRKNGLNPDGIVGPATRKALGVVVKQEPNNLPTERPKLFKTSRRVVELIWHCTATPEGREHTVDDIDRWHKNRKWSGIGYHYVVHLDGSISIGRTVNKKGAHVGGRNSGTIGAVYVGGVGKDGKTPKDTRTPDQIEAMLWLTQELDKLYNFGKITGHNRYAAKACPSFDVSKTELGRG